MLPTQCYLLNVTYSKLPRCPHIKVEIRLRKATGVRWDSLEHKETMDVNQRVYPTSNRRNPVDWDRVEAEVMTTE